MNERKALERENRTYKFSLFGTLFTIPVLCFLFVQGRTDIVAVFGVGFMLGYVVERTVLHKRFASMYRTHVS